jgi:predicted dehydrogenase
MSSDRRKFIRQLGGSAMLLTAGSLKSFASQEQFETHILQTSKKYSPNDNIQIAVVGAGIMGHHDVATAVKIPGVKLVACCDLYDGRRQHMQELYGKDIFTTKHHEEIIARKDIDAVIVATSDNWHSRICIDAMKAGKAVYNEKPMVHKIDQGLDVIKTQQETKAVMQVGSQRVSSISFAKAKELYKAGEIGQINAVEAVFNRQSALGAWEYTMPTDQSTATVDWDRYQLHAAHKYGYDPKRFFWWRNYREYGTGVAGDLFVHLLSGLHFITDSKGPSKIFSIGDTVYWKDGRDVPDVMTGILSYPETKEHPAFQVSLRVNFISGEGDYGYTKIIGSEGMMNVSEGGFTITHSKLTKAPGIGGWDALETYPEAMQKELLAAYNSKYSDADKHANNKPKIAYAVPAGYDEHLDHFSNFFASMRNEKPVVEDPVFGFRAAAPCLLCNESYFENKVMYWDAENMKLL